MFSNLDGCNKRSLSERNINGISSSGSNCSKQAAESWQSFPETKVKLRRKDLDFDEIITQREMSFQGEYFTLKIWWNGNKRQIRFFQFIEYQVSDVKVQCSGDFNSDGSNVDGLNSLRLTYFFTPI